MKIMAANKSCTQMTSSQDTLPPTLRPPRATPDAMMDPVNLRKSVRSHVSRKEKSEWNSRPYQKQLKMAVTMPLYAGCETSTTYIGPAADAILTP